MTVLSGKYIAFSAEGSEVTKNANWSVNELTEPWRHRSSGTGAGTGRGPGIYDFNGSFEHFADEPWYMPGDYFDFIGYTAPDTGARNTAGETVAGTNAIVESVVGTWDWTNGQATVRWLVNFACGEPVALVRGPGTVIDDNAHTLCSYCSKKIQYGASAAEQDWENVTQATLTITADNASFVNSSTNCIRGRRKGPIDWTLSVVEENTKPTFPIQSEQRLLLPVCDTTTWILQWGIVESLTDYRVDADTGDIIRVTNNFAMVSNAFQTGALGMIERPTDTPNDGSAPWWPTQFHAATNPF